MLKVEYLFVRSQLGVYTDKYDEFQNALVKSNQVFGGFKEQMEKVCICTTVIIVLADVIISCVC